MPERKKPEGYNYFGYNLNSSPMEGVSTTPAASQPMGHIHSEDQPKMFGMLPWGKLLEEGQFQQLLKKLIDQERQAQHKPANWDPRDVNLPNEAKK